MMRVDKRFGEACDRLHQLGVTGNYKGCRYTAYAVALCAEEPDLLLLVTKNLYPEVARQYSTTWQAVERDIRTVIGVAWKRNPVLLGEMAGICLWSKPCSAQFLAIVSEDLRRSRAS